MLCTAVGAAAGYSSTLLRSDDNGPIVSYWVASDILTVTDPAFGTSDIALSRLAQNATLGDVPNAAAESLGVDPEQFRSSIRAVTNAADGIVELSAVALSPEDARARVDALTGTFLDELRANQQRAHDDAVADANAEVERHRLERSRLEALIEDLTVTQEAGDATDDDLAQLRDLNSQRDLENVLYATAINTAAEVRRQPVPEPELELTENVRQVQIDAGTYGSRITLGSAGNRVFSANEVGLTRAVTASTGSAFDSAAARALLAGLIGLLLGVAAVLLHFRLDPRLRTPEDVERAFGYSVIGEVPVISRRDRRDQVLHAVDRPRSYVTEAHRYLRSALLFARFTFAPRPVHDLTDSHSLSTPTHDDPAALHAVTPASGDERQARVVMVTSPGAAEGKTTTAANLAVTLAEAGYDTVLINCDHRIPRAHEMLGLPYLPGEVQETGVPDLLFIADVERDIYTTPERISERQRSVIDRARQVVDVVVLDTAPILATNDAVDLLPSTDLVVVVCREGKTTADDAADARDLLDRMGVPVAGVLVTGARSILGGRYYARYRYGRYYRDERPKARRKAKRARAPERRPSYIPKRGRQPARPDIDLTRSASVDDEVVIDLRDRAVARHDGDTGQPGGRPQT